MEAGIGNTGISKGFPSFPGRRRFPMDDPELRKLLEQLHSEIEQTKTVDDKGKDLLRHLQRDIGVLLQRSESAETEAEGSFAGRLEDSIDHFEITHPTLTTILSKVLATLSNAGV
jgi:hypothetical protein